MKKTIIAIVSILCVMSFCSCGSEKNSLSETAATTTTTTVTTKAKIEEPTKDDEPSKWAEYISDSYVELIDYKQTASDNGKYDIEIRAVADLATNPNLTVKNL